MEDSQPAQKNGRSVRRTRIVVIMDSPTEPRTTEPRKTEPRKTQPRMD
jgi:hypothetical protein